jgi:hypothetical protein
MAASGQLQSDAPAIVSAELSPVESGGTAIELEAAVADVARSAAVDSSADAPGEAATLSLAAAEEAIEQLRTTMAQTGASGGSGQDPTPIQSSLMEALGLRAAAGLPVPLVTYDLQSSLGEGMGLAAAVEALSQGAAAENVTITAITTILFDNPQQAGYDEWPALIVEGGSPIGMDGSFIEGDYTEAYRAALEAKAPGIWEQYEFGQEPRLHTITESFVVSFPDAASLTAAEVATTEDILMGFTYTGPHFDYTIGAEACVPVLGCLFKFKAGFELDWGLGLRLPAEVTLTGPDVVEQGTDYNLSSVLNPLDWSASDYSIAGVAPEDGNEFVLHLDAFAGIEAEIAGFDVCPGCNVSANIDESESFATPFGAGSSFPLSTVTINLLNFDVAVLSFSAGIGIDPDIGSDEITAEWRAVPGSDCSGSGDVTYTTPGDPVTIGPVTACDLGSTDEAEVELSNFKYYFSQFLIALTAELRFELFTFDTASASVPIVDFDLSGITGDLYVSDHVECDFLFNCGEVGPDNTLSVISTAVDTTAPTTSIALNGTLGNNDWYVSDVEAPVRSCSRKTVKQPSTSVLPTMTGTSRRPRCNSSRSTRPRLKSPPRSLRHPTSMAGITPTWLFTSRPPTRLPDSSLSRRT